MRNVWHSCRGRPSRDWTNSSRGVQTSLSTRRQVRAVGARCRCIIALCGTCACLLRIDHWCRRSYGSVHQPTCRFQIRCITPRLTARARYGLALVPSRLALHVAGHCTTSATQCPRCGRLRGGCGRCLLRTFRHPATHWFPCFLTVPWLLNHRAYLAGGGAGAGATTGMLVLHRVGTMRARG